MKLAGGPERVVAIAEYGGAQQTGVRFSSGMRGDKRAWHAIRTIGALIEAGRFSLPVAQTVALEEIGDAQELSQTSHARGKLVLLVG